MADAIPESHPDLKHVLNEVRRFLERNEAQGFSTKGLGHRTARDPAPVPIHFERSRHPLPGGKWVWKATDGQGRSVFGEAVHAVEDQSDALRIARLALEQQCAKLGWDPRQFPDPAIVGHGGPDGANVRQWMVRYVSTEDASLLAKVVIYPDGTPVLTWIRP